MKKKLTIAIPTYNFEKYKHLKTICKLKANQILLPEGDGAGAADGLISLSSKILLSEVILIFY